MNSRSFWLMSGAATVLAICVTVACAGTAGWPQISDDVLMHYVVFLARHGMVPYRDVIDPNMPGSYAVDAAAGALLGGTAWAWRLFDWLLTALAAGSIIAAVRRRSLLAGWFGAALFALWHVGDGVAQAGQRDFILAVLLLAGYPAFLRGASGATGERGSAAARASGRGLAWLAAWGACCGIAATIKPQAALYWLALTGLLWWRAHRRHERVALLLASGAVGFTLPLGMVLVWLARRGALGAFVQTVRGLDVYHASMARHPLSFLLRHAVPTQLLVLLAGAGMLWVVARVQRRFELVCVLTGIAFGVFSFCAQGKAYPYHRYPLIGFLMLFVAMALAEAMPAFADRPDAARPARTLAAWLLLYGACWLGPASTAKALRYDWRQTPSLDALKADLQGLGGQRLQGQVQCMDTMAGCITALDRMQLVQSTGFLYDCYFFAPARGPAAAATQAQVRSRFLATIERKPPAVFVVTDQWCLNLPSGYGKLAQWPAFERFLAEHYAKTVERSWKVQNPRYLATWPFGYQIYVRRGVSGAAPPAQP